jgi:hypothetical protein
MPAHDAATPPSDAQLTGTAWEFAEFSKRDRRRRLNTEGDFDPTLFDEAVAYILHKLITRDQEAEA